MSSILSKNVKPPAIINNPFIDLASHKSWLLNARKDLFPEQIKKRISELLRERVGNRLAMITKNGELYEIHQSLEINNGKIQVTKPTDWRNSTSSFHLFFKNKNNTWNFFKPANIAFYPSFFLFNPPSKVFFLQRRRYKRIPAPAGTEAIFRASGQLIDNAYVQDISEGGMRIGINSVKDKYPLDSIINEILIAIPSKSKKGRGNIARRIIPVINKGKIVRSFYDQERSISSYGISFLTKNKKPRKEIHDLVTYLENVNDYPHLFEVKA